MEVNVSLADLRRAITGDEGKLVKMTGVTTRPGGVSAVVPQQIPRQKVVDIPPAADPGIVLFPCDLTLDGGDDGDATTTPSYTYTAKSADGKQTFYTLTPETGRNIGSYQPAVEGSAYFDDDENFVLFTADEKRNKVVCGT